MSAREGCPVAALRALAMESATAARVRYPHMLDRRRYCPSAWETNA